MPVEVRNLLKATCDGPNCAEHHKQVVTLEWDDSQPDACQDDVFRLLTVVTADEKRHVFCSATCTVGWLDKSYKPIMFQDDNPNYADKRGHGDSLPLTILFVSGEKKTFSSAASAKDYLKTQFIPPLSPREQEARDKAEKKKTESVE
jgi:hypothetical protein